MVMHAAMLMPSCLSPNSRMRQDGVLMNGSQSKNMMKTAPLAEPAREEAGKRPFFPELARRIEGFFSANRKLIGYLQAVMFFGFLAFIIVPPFLPLPPDESGLLDSFSMLASFALWGLWFPLVLLSTVFMGRAWCGVLCPQGALSEQASRHGLDRKLPGWMKWEGTPILSFIIVTILGQTLGVRDYPHPALLIFGGTMLLAAVAGLVYARRYRAWCRYLCPIGLLLGVFSRLGAVSFERMQNKIALGAAKGLCPNFIDLAGKNSSRHCIECFRCTGVRKGSLSLTIRKPGREIESIAGSAPSIYEVAFLFLATGLALGAFHWQINPIYIRFKLAVGSFFLDNGLGWLAGWSGPWWVMVNYPEAGEVFNFVDVAAIVSFMSLSMLLALLALALLTALSAVLLHGRELTLGRVVELGYVYAPVSLISVVLGLGLVFFEKLGALGVSSDWVKWLEGMLFLAGALWSAYIAMKLQGRRPISLIPTLSGIGLVAFAWSRVFF